MSNQRVILLLCIAVLSPLKLLGAAESTSGRAQSFDADPEWEGFRNRLEQERPQRAEQNFGYRTTNRAGGTATGEIGGVIQRLQ